MTETTRLAIIWAVVVVVVALVMGATITACVWRNNDRLGPAQKLQNDRKVEEIRACAHAVDVTSCLRDATG